MARSSPSLWGIGPVSLLSQRENEAPPRKLGGSLGKKVRLLPNHIRHWKNAGAQFAILGIEGACIAVALVDILIQVFDMRSLTRSIADDQGFDIPRTRKAILTRIVAYGLHFIDYAYRLSVAYLFLEDWTGPGSSLYRRLQALLPRTSYSYKYLRGTTTTAICSVLIYGVVESPIRHPISDLTDELVMREVAEIILVFFRHLPIVLVLFSLYHLIFNLVLSSKHLAKWIYPYQRVVDRVTFRFQVDRWYRREKSSSLGLDLGPGSESLDEGNHERPIYAPPQTILPGETLAKRLPAARQQPITHTPLFVRCRCCLDDQSAIDLADLVQRSRDLDRNSFWSTSERRETQAYGDFLAQRKTFLELHQASLVNRSWETDQATHIENDRLCEYCDALAFRLQHDFDESWFSSWIRGWTSARDFRTYRHLSNSICLADSAKTRHLCAVFWQELSTEQQDQLKKYDAALQSAPNPDIQLDRRICITFDRELRELVAHFGDFSRPRRWVYPAKGHDSDLMVKQLQGREARPPIVVASGNNAGNLRIPEILNTGSDLSCGLIRQWLQLLGTVPTNDDFIPSRLVDVSTLSTNTVRIVHRQDVPRDERRYIALSHCWGSTDFRKYNKSTKESFESIIPLDEMPKTFEDVFQLAHQLDIRYVWIDALCILQDDKDDWERESSTMYQVYLRATLTVVASASWSSTEGLFRPAPSLRKSHCFLYEKRDKGQTDDNCTFAWSERDSEDATRHDNNIKWSRWGSRAWTLQEQALSSRIVYFTDTGLVFEEKDVIRGETSGVRLSTTDESYHVDEWIRSRKGHGDGPIISLSSRGTQADLPTAWWTWVSEYTPRGLTNADDRATAILGLAQYLSRPAPNDDDSIDRPNDENLIDRPNDTTSKPRYLAGLWEQSLAESLLWYVQLGATARPLDPVRAPSWSWISVQGGIVNDSVGLDATATGVEIESVKEIRPTRPRPLERKSFLDISPTLEKGSFIQLKGKVRDLTVLDQAQQPKYYHSSSADLCVDRYPELRFNAALGALSIASEQPTGPRCYPLRLTGTDTEPCVGWYIPDTTDDSALPEVLHCLCITVEPCDTKGKEDYTQPWATRGLALRSVHSEEKDAIPAYERVGYFELEWRGNGAFLPYDANHSSDRKYNIRRVEPSIDPHGVFKGVKVTSLRLY